MTLTLEKAKKLPIKKQLDIFAKMKKELKKDKVVKDMFDEFDLDVDTLDLVPMMFADLDVSAKCDHGVIYFNYKLLCDNFEDNYSYAVHELTHFCQQCYGDKPTQSADDGEYLDNKFEQAGFSNQVEYISNNDGEEVAEDYVEQLLDYHEVDKKSKKDELSAILLEKA